MIISLNKEYGKVLSRWKFNQEEYKYCKRFLYIQESEVFVNKGSYDCVLVNISSLIGKNDKIINFREEESNVNTYFGTYTKANPNSDKLSKEDVITIESALYNMNFIPIEEINVKASLSNILLGYDHIPFAEQSRNVYVGNKNYEIREADPYPQYFRFVDQENHGRINTSFTTDLLREGPIPFQLKDILIEDNDVMSIEKIKLKSSGFDNMNGVPMNFGMADMSRLVYNILSKIKKSMEDHGFRSGTVTFAPTGFNFVNPKTMVYCISQEELDFKGASLSLCLQSIYTFDYESMFKPDGISIYFNMTPHYNDVKIIFNGRYANKSYDFNVASESLYQDIMESSGSYL